MNRFSVRDDPEHINIVDVLDGSEPVVRHVSKPRGEAVVAILNAKVHLPANVEALKNVIHRANAYAGYIPNMGQVFEAGVRAGLTMGEEANPDAEVYRVPCLNQAYRAGVILGQQLVKGETPFV